MRTIIVLALCVLSAVSARAAVLTVAQDGSGDYMTIMAAMGAAAEGDEIVVTDSAVYVEDVSAGAAAGLAASFTLRAAEGETPTIRAANTAERLGALGIPGRDLQGVMLFGCQNAVVRGFRIENANLEPNANGNTATMAIADSVGVTVRDCSFYGPGGVGTSYPGDNFLILLAGVESPPSDILIENCDFQEGYIGIVVAKLAPGAPADPSVTVRGCRFENFVNSAIEPDNGAPPDNTDPAIHTGAGNLIEDCWIANADGPIDVGGGYTVIRNTTIVGGHGSGINADLDGPHGTRPLTVIVEGCDIVGNGSYGIRCEEGTLRVSDTIIAGQGSEAVYLQDIDVPLDASFDHCDIYYNNLSQLVYEVVALTKPGGSVRVTMTNTNVLGVSGVINGDPANEGVFDPEAFSIANCNLFVEFPGEAAVNIEPADSVSVDPRYANPSNSAEDYTREGFRLAAGSPAADAGVGGTFIGALGPGKSAVGDWDLY